MSHEFDTTVTPPRIDGRGWDVGAGYSRILMTSPAPAATAPVVT